MAPIACHRGLLRREGVHRHDLLRNLRTNLSTKAMQDGCRCLAVVVEVHALRLHQSGATHELRRRNVLLRRQTQREDADRRGR